MATRSAVHSIDWSKLTVSLGLQKETILALQAFRKRNEEAKRALTALKEQKTQVDFEHYRSILKNKGIVNEAENALNGFKPTKVDLDKQLKIIGTFEEKAVASAKKISTKADSELRDLHVTLTNMEEARPFKELTVEEVVKAKPEIVDIVEKMVKKHRWAVPGYEETYGY
ncbi:hypothetical protein Glove_152g35 [Diversispora epigaea]|uniref:ATP synthase subunit d, mitochondrial n=1 Tax=Diversispora epigaea TaxID=1348612 RepID=A0A397IZ16_9GLOM|nr:hypothetical protein Glove_152g35 [Diversispora epigaea]